MLRQAVWRLNKGKGGSGRWISVTANDDYVEPLHRGHCVIDAMQLSNDVPHKVQH